MTEWLRTSHAHEQLWMSPKYWGDYDEKKPAI
jgi:hypothetical protein